MRIRRGVVVTGITMASISISVATAGAAGLTTVTTGYTFLPLNQIGHTLTFKVIPPVP